MPYGVKVLIPECRQDIATLIGADDKCFAVKYGKNTFYCPFHISIKPYLRPMSSMTKEEEKEYNDLYYDAPQFKDGWRDAKYLEGLHIDWLNKHHFDYRGLIEKGLAISTEENNPYKS